MCHICVVSNDIWVTERMTWHKRELTCWTSLSLSLSIKGNNCAVHNASNRKRHFIFKFHQRLWILLFDSFYFFFVLFMLFLRFWASKVANCAVRGVSNRRRYFIFKFHRHLWILLFNRQLNQTFNVLFKNVVRGYRDCFRKVLAFICNVSITGMYRGM